MWFLQQTYNAVTPESVSSATIDAATSEQEINQIKNKQNTLGLGCITHCHLSLIDGGLYLSISLNNLVNFEAYCNTVDLTL